MGRRLKHVKENDLAHGQWSQWLSTFSMDRTQAHKFIKVSEEFSNVATLQQIGINVLYEISTLPEPERTKEHVTSSGETKTPDDMTVRELRELKKRIKQRDEQNAQLQSQVELVGHSKEF
ncbi:DUF3102 domain-containing protein [Staphylococcus hyicus]|uniref:DUF3102 domain-containing protein n=1 Tax=Staphylococcus TaxID=1279 RepID=UPI00211CBB0D|nr:DUF3102 domain-containing protein [Staphylococcus hyicus]